MPLHTKEASLEEVPYLANGIGANDHDGLKIIYRFNGKLHRLDGPAIEFNKMHYAYWRYSKNGYFIRHKQYKKKDYLVHPEVVEYKMFKQNKGLEMIDI